jgi:hypothetical protein
VVRLCEELSKRRAAVGENELKRIDDVFIRIGGGSSRIPIEPCAGIFAETNFGSDEPQLRLTQVFPALLVSLSEFPEKSEQRHAMTDPAARYFHFPPG